MKPTKEHLIEYMQLLILFHEPIDHVTLLGDIFDEIELLKAIKRELENREGVNYDKIPTIIYSN